MITLVTIQLELDADWQNIETCLRNTWTVPTPGNKRLFYSWDIIPTAPVMADNIDNIADNIDYLNVFYKSRVFEYLI